MGSRLPVSFLVADVAVEQVSAYGGGLPVQRRAQVRAERASGPDDLFELGPLRDDTLLKASGNERGYENGGGEEEHRGQEGEEPAEPAPSGGRGSTGRPHSTSLGHSTDEHPSARKRQLRATAAIMGGDFESGKLGKEVIRQR